MKKSNWSITLLAALLVIWLGWSIFDAYRPQPVVLHGQVEAQEYSMSSKVPGRIDSVLVRRGDQVNIGQLLFTIDSPEVEAKLLQAQGISRAASAAQEAADAGSREQEIEIARDNWQAAKAAEDLARKSFDRMNNLFRDGVVAEQRRDEVYAAYQAAQYTTQAAFQVYSIAQEGARAETREVAAGESQAASGLVAEVEAARADTEVRSRYEGEVANVFLHEGELAPQGFPVVTIVNPEEAWAVFQVREDLLHHVEKGSQLQILVPALDGGVYPFVVTHISVMGSFATWRSTSSGEGYDLRTFEVEARPEQPIENLRPGMTVVLQL